MISCSNDILTIGPALTRTEILGKLADCGEQYVASWLPRILSADLPATLEVLLAKKYTWLTAGQKQRVRTEVGEATTSEIEKRFREMVAVRIQRCPGQDIQIEFRKTLRVPDDGKTYPLPPGLGSFPIENLAHHAARIPASWGELGGVLVPMHQSEAMWLDFDGDWPTALKIGTGTVNSINGRNWTGGLIREPQGYVVLPEQPWLDGYCTAPGVVRQFVATSLGKCQSAEEQTLGTMRGGLQLEAFPLKVESYFEKKLRAALPRTAEDLVADYLLNGEGGVISSQSPCQLMELMGLGAGGRIKQEIYEDQWEPQDWDLTRSSRTWVHLVDVGVWKVVTGRTAPGKPLTAKEYNKHGFPWFDYYRDDMESLKGSEVLANLKSVFDPLSGNGKSQGPDDGGVTGIRVKAIGHDAPTDRVKDWDGNVGEQDDQLARPSVPPDQEQSMKAQKRLERQRTNAATNRFMLWLVSCGVAALMVWIFFMSIPSQTFTTELRSMQPKETLIEKVVREARENVLARRSVELRGPFPHRIDIAPPFPPAVPMLRVSEVNRTNSSDPRHDSSAVPAAKEFLDGRKVKFNTRGHTKSKGLNLTFYYPQSWTAKEGERPNILQKFVSEHGTGLAMATIVTKDSGIPTGTILSDSELREILKEMYATEELKSMVPEGANLLGAKSTSIGGVPAEMVEFSLRTNRAGMDIESQYLSFNFIINSTFVIFSGGVSMMPESKTGLAVDSRNLAKEMEDFRPLFTLMASSIILEDKWK